MTGMVPALDIGESLSNALDSVISFIPNLLVFIVILVIGWIIAKIVSKLLVTVLEKVGFNKLVEKAGLTRFFQGSSLINLFGKLVYYFILLLALQLALTAFGDQNPVSQIVNDIIGWLPKVVIAIVIVVIAAAIANAVKDIVSGALSSLSYGEMIGKIVAGFIIALGVIAALGQVGIALAVTLPVLITVLATIGGILVVGVGGGLIKPMQQRWEGWLQGMDNERRKVAESSRAGGSSGGTSGGQGSTTTYGSSGSGTTDGPAQY